MLLLGDQAVPAPTACVPSTTTEALERESPVPNHRSQCFSLPPRRVHRPQKPEGSNPMSRALLFPGHRCLAGSPAGHRTSRNEEHPWRCTIAPSSTPSFPRAVRPLAAPPSSSGGERSCRLRLLPLHPLAGEPRHCAGLCVTARLPRHGDPLRHPTARRSHTSAKPVTRQLDRSRGLHAGATSVVPPPPGPCPGLLLPVFSSTSHSCNSLSLPVLRNTSKELQRPWPRLASGTKPDRAPRPHPCLLELTPALLCVFSPWPRSLFPPL